LCGVLTITSRVCVPIARVDRVEVKFEARLFQRHLPRDGVGGEQHRFVTEPGRRTCCKSRSLAGRACLGDNDNSQALIEPNNGDNDGKVPRALQGTHVRSCDEWMKKPEQERKLEETRMMDAWKKWMTANASKVADKGAGAGKPKVISSSGVKDARNDIMMYQIVQANSADEAAKMFMDHPHFGIPQASIEVMPLKAMEG
jgi:hypothetical protein